MKYFLKINGVEYQNVSSITITGKYRNESVQKNLAGGYIVDRIGTEKITLNAVLNMLTPADMAALRAARALVSCEVEFDRDNSRHKKTMRILEFIEPPPLYFYGKKEAGMIYDKINITAEEM